MTAFMFVAVGDLLALVQSQVDPGADINTVSDVYITYYLHLFLGILFSLSMSYCHIVYE